MFTFFVFFVGLLFHQRLLCIKNLLNWILICFLIIKRLTCFVCLNHEIHANASMLNPPHLHLTKSKVMVIVWRLRGNIIRTVLYIANVLLLQWAQLTKTVHTARLGLEFVLLLGCMICLYVGVCFVLPWTVESFPFMFWRWRNKLKWAPFELFAPSLSLRLELAPSRAIVNRKQWETRGLFMSLVIHYWIGDVQGSHQGVSISQNANYKYF